MWKTPSNNPLVSIMIPNWNYGQFLGTCIHSCLQQTYQNIEIVICDNASTDNSVDVLEEFVDYHLGLNINFFDKHVSAEGNHARCRAESNPKSKYMLYLSSDDWLAPNAIAKCVALMEEWPRVGMTIMHRKDVCGDLITEQPPFYKYSCVVPGEEQMKVFMMAGIGVTSQCMRRRSVDDEIPRSHSKFNICGDWYDNFAHACISDVGYLKEPLVYYRQHNGETQRGMMNLRLPLESYELVHTFAEMAESIGRSAVAARLPEAISKLSEMCVRYGGIALTQLKNEELAWRYLHLAKSFDHSILNNSGFWWLEGALKGYHTLVNCPGYSRTQSYAPPAGSVILP